MDARVPWIIAHRQVVSGLSAQVVSQEETSYRMEYSSRHLHHVLHDLLYRRVWDRHVYRADSYHKIQSGDDVAGILYKFVEVGEVVAALGMCVG